MRIPTLFRTIALRTFFHIVVCVAGLTTLACGGGEAATILAPLEPAVAANLTLSPLSLREIGQTATVTVATRGDDGRVFYSGVVTWATSDPSVVTISSTGPRSALAVAVGDGQATITASLGTSFVNGTVGVVRPNLTLSLQPVLRSGQTTTASVAAQGDDGRIFQSGVVTWATSDPSVVTISSNGPRSASAVAVGIGQATITASLGTRSVNGAVSVISPSTPQYESAFIYTEQGGMTILDVPADLKGADARAVNDLGQVVGTLYTSPGGSHAFIWSAATGMIDLGGLRAGGYATASTISQNGQVAGSGGGPDGRTHAFRWTRERGMVDIGGLPGDGNSYAYGINSSSQIVGVSYGPEGPKPFLWTPDRGMESPGSAAAVPFGYAFAINEAGQIAGALPTFDYEYPYAGAILWSAAGTKSDISPCPPRDRFCGAAAFAINGNGMVAGTDGRNAFVWTNAAGVRTIANPSEGSYLYPSGINDSGTVVGNIFGGGTSGGFIWSEARGYREIRPPAGRSVVYVTGINNLGQIVGTVR